MRNVLTALAIAAAIAGAALGAAKPYIESVSPERAFAGGVVRLRGTNFSDAIGDVSVTVSGESCIVIATTPQEITFMLPTAIKKGPHPVEVTVGGEKSNRVTVTIRPEEEREQAKREELERAEGGAGPVQVKYLVLDVPQYSKERGTSMIIAPGRAEYPDGCVIQLELRLDNHLVANGQATVQARAFRGTIGPFDRDLFAGHYEVQAFFNLSLQSGAIRRAFKETIKDPKMQAEMRQARDRQYVRVGTSAEEDWQKRELRGYFSGALARSRELLRELESNYAAAARSLFRGDDGKVKEDEWAAWVSQRLLRGVEGEEREKRLAELRKNEQFLNRDGTFDDQAWREWLDYKWREDGVLKLVKDHVAYRDRFVVMRFHDEMLRLEEIFSGLVRLSQARSQDLYMRNGLPVAASDRALQHQDLLRIGGGMGAVSPAIIETTARRIAKAVGLEEERPSR